MIDVGAVHRYLWTNQLTHSETRDNQFRKFTLHLEQLSQFSKLRQNMQSSLHWSLLLSVSFLGVYFDHNIRMLLPPKKKCILLRHSGIIHFSCSKFCAAVRSVLDMYNNRFPVKLHHLLRLKISLFSMSLKMRRSLVNL